MLSSRSWRSFSSAAFFLLFEQANTPKTIEIIDAYAFADCNSLKYITNLKNTKVGILGTSAFENCELLEELEFPKELEAIGSAAFAGCKGIKKITFPKNSALKVIGNHCFKGCENIEEIALPDGMEMIGISAFADCKSLKKISIPKTCENEPGIVEIYEREGIQVECRSLEGVK